MSQSNHTVLLGLHSLVLMATPMNWQQVFRHFACHQPVLSRGEHWCQDGVPHTWGKEEGPFCCQQVVYTGHSTKLHHELPTPATPLAPSPASVIHSFTLNPSAPVVTSFVSFLEESTALASCMPGSCPKLIQVLAFTVTASHLKIPHFSPQSLPALWFEQQAS